jgi:anti-anti-sigma regulatory factor
MLKITKQGTSNGRQMVKLEGKLTGDWVDELARVTATEAPARLTLDLSSISFVDSKGVELLRNLISRHVQLSGCSAFVSDLILGG